MNLQHDTFVCEQATRVGLRAANRRRRLDEILNASWTVLGAEGYSGFSMRKVAQALGVRLNTIQHYFGDLQSLLLETIRGGLSRYPVRYRIILNDKTLAPHERLDAVLEDMFREASDPVIGAISIEIWALAQRDVLVAQLVKQMYAEVIDSLAMVVREIDPKKSLAEAQDMVTALVAMAEGTVALTQLGAMSPNVSKTCMSLARFACSAKQKSNSR